MAPSDAGTLSSTDNSFDAFVVQLAPSGQQNWVQVFEGAGDERLEGVALQSDGTVIVIGFSDSSIDLGDGVQHDVSGAFVAALEETGAPKWLRRLSDLENGAGSLAASGVAVTAGDDIVVSGNFHGGPLGCPDQVGGNDVHVVGLDATGHLRWLKSGGSAIHSPRVAAGAAGSIYVAAPGNGADFGLGPLPNAGDYDVYLAKLAVTEQGGGD